MDLTSFYALLAGTSFTLVGLWWMVLERRPRWKSDPLRRRLAGGTYLSFLLPGLMATLAQLSPATPALWRTSFAACALVGLVSTFRLLSVESGVGHKGPFRRFR
ncbi:hypothetical protein ACPCG0_13065 [Propionibacteriaceae bacterium Y1923]